jgi:hypothetical protein
LALLADVLSGKPFSPGGDAALRSATAEATIAAIFGSASAFFSSANITAERYWRHVAGVNSTLFAISQFTKARIVKENAVTVAFADTPSSILAFLKSRRKRSAYSASVSCVRVRSLIFLSFEDIDRGTTAAYGRLAAGLVCPLLES